MDIQKKDVNAALYLVDRLERAEIEHPENALCFCVHAAAMNYMASKKRALLYPRRRLYVYVNLIVGYLTKKGFHGDLFVDEYGQIFETKKLRLYLKGLRGAPPIDGARLIIEDKKAAFLQYYEVK